jgi:ribosomal protein L18
MFDPITATIVAISTVASAVSSEKSRKQQKKASRVQERVRQTQDSRARIAQVREARRAQAQIIQSGATQGAMNSSAVQGGVAAVGSNAENNIQFINQVDNFQQTIARRMESANKFQGMASTFGAVASIAGSFAGSTETDGDK